MNTQINGNNFVTPRLRIELKKKKKKVRPYKQTPF